MYEKSGKIVEFLDKWKCSSLLTAECVMELVDEFVYGCKISAKSLFQTKRILWRRGQESDERVDKNSE